MPALRSYARAVAERTRAITDTLAPGAWEEAVPPERIRRVVVDEGLLLDAGRWVEEFWARGHARGWYLLQTGLLHPYGHWFDAGATRGQLGSRGRSTARRRPTLTRGGGGWGSGGRGGEGGGGGAIIVLG